MQTMNPFEANYMQKMTSVGLDQTKLSDLASKYMRIFDDSNFDSSALGKRSFQEPNINLYNQDRNHNSAQISALLENQARKMFHADSAQPIFNMGAQTNQMQAIFSQMNSSFTPNFSSQMHAQNVNMLNFIQHRRQGFNNNMITMNGNEFPPSKIMNDTLNKLMNVNDEFFKTDFTSETNCDNSPSTDHTKVSVRDKEKAFKQYNQEPALLEFTQTFPNWDISTIFKFLKGDKTMEVFERELRGKVRRRRRRPKLPLKPSGNISTTATTVAPANKA